MDKVQAIQGGRICYDPATLIPGSYFTTSYDNAAYLYDGKRWRKCKDAAEAQALKEQMEKGQCLSRGKQ